MKGRSARWDATITQSHQIAVQVDVLFNRSTYLSNVALSSGAVTLDRTAAQLARLTATFAEPLLIPTQIGGPLTPYGYELFVRRGITYGDGTTELMQLGVFPIQQSQLDGVSLTTSVTAVDRSQLVSDARFEDDYSVAAGTNTAGAIFSVIDDGVPGLTYWFGPTSYTTPLLTFPAQSDRWTAAQSMATSCGMVLQFGGDGSVLLYAEPTSTQPLLTVGDGPGGVMVGAALTLDRSSAYNRVIATGENTGNAAVYRGVWTDVDVSSPTYYSGPFGRKPRFYTSPFITSDAQAVSAASAIGQSLRGVARSLDFAAVPNPALEPGDSIQVVRSALGLNEVHSIDSLTIDLGTGAMTGKSRLLQS